MEATVDLKELRTAVRHVKAGMARRPNLPVLTGARVVAVGDRITLTTTDIDLTVKASIRAEVTRRGVQVIPFHALTELTKGSAKGSVVLRANGDQIELVNGITTKVPAHPSEEWPRIESFVGAVRYPLDLDALAEVVIATTFDEARPIFNGVLLDGNEMVATDSYRLHVVQTEAVGPGVRGYPKVLLPARVIAAVVKYGKPAILHVSTTAKPAYRYGTVREESFQLVHRCKVTAGDATWYARAIEGDFPNWRGLIPSNQPNRLVVDRSAIVTALKHVMPMAKHTAPVRVTLAQGRVHLLAQTHNVGEAETDVPATYVGAELTIGFNPAFLLDAFQTGPGPEVVLECVDAMKPAVIREERTDGRRSIRVLMPVRVSS